VAAVGVRRFVSFYENRGDTLLNLASLVTIIKLGELWVCFVCYIGLSFLVHREVYYLLMYKLTDR